jgi:hypothetical protein
MWQMEKERITMRVNMKMGMMKVNVKIMKDMESARQFFSPLVGFHELIFRCGRALGPHGDKDHHLKPPDPDPNIPLPPPLIPSASITTMPELPRMPIHHAEYEEDLSRASTPSID